jgi:hypothetical protein
VTVYRDHLKAKGHDVVDYGYKIVDNTNDLTVWRPEHPGNAMCVDADNPKVVEDLYTYAGQDPTTPATTGQAPEVTPDLVSDALRGDPDAFSTTGGKYGTGVKYDPKDMLGWVLDNEANGASETP